MSPIQNIKKWSQLGLLKSVIEDSHTNCSLQCTWVNTILDAETMKCSHFFFRLGIELADYHFHAPLKLEKNAFSLS